MPQTSVFFLNMDLVSLKTKKAWFIPAFQYMGHNLGCLFSFLQCLNTSVKLINTCKTSPAALL